MGREGDSRDFKKQALLQYEDNTLRLHILFIESKRVRHATEAISVRI